MKTLAILADAGLIAFSFLMTATVYHHLETLIPNVPARLTVMISLVSVGGAVLVAMRRHYWTIDLRREA